MNDFIKGTITGAVAAVVVFGVIVGLVYCNHRDKELLEYAEQQTELQVLREDYVSRNPDELLELPGVRGAVDGASTDFERRRDELLQQFRSGLAD
jgi:hypothetical protein